MKLRTRLLAVALVLVAPAMAYAQRARYAAPDGNNTIPVSVVNPLPVQQQIYPSAQAPVIASSGNVANASAVATLSGTTGKTTYLGGFRCQAAGATAASVVNLTITGLLGGTVTYTFAFPAGATVAATPVGEDFSNPIPASATNTAIVVTLPAGGSGNLNASCVAYGRQQ